jgi:hypothetical protein
MNKNRWLLAVLVLLVLLGISILALKIHTDRHREAAVDRLRVKAEHFEHLLSASKPTGAKAPRDDSPDPVPDTTSAGQPASAPASTNGQEPKEESAASVPVANAKMEMPDEDAIAAFDRLRKSLGELYNDARWQEALSLIGNQNWGEWTDRDRRLVAAFLEANRSLILELRRLAASNTPLYDLDYSLGYAMPLPHLAELRAFARILAADALLAAGTGGHEEIVKDLMAISRLAGIAGEEPILVSQLVSNAITSLLYDCLEQSLRGEDLSPGMAAQLIREISQLSGREGFSNALILEGLFGLEAFEGIRMGDLDRAGMEYEGMMNRLLMRVYGSVLARPLLNLDESTYAGLIDRLGDTLDRPYYEVKPLLEQISAEVDRLPSTRIMSRFLFPALTNAAEIQAQQQAYIGLMQVGLAIEQHHAQHGQYPRNLDDIAPALGGTVPLDPFTGQPFVYQPLSGTFLLYSAMGSAVDFSQRQRPGLVDEQGNIVWRGQR